jgi:hypothetical protein
MSPIRADSRGKLDVCRQYYANWKSLRALLGEYPAEESRRLRENLQWYGLSVDYLASREGLRHIFAYSLKRNLAEESDVDQNAANYSLLTFYNRPVPALPAGVSNPSVWSYQGLSTGPWHDDVPAVRALFERNAPVVIDEYERMKSRLAESSEESLREVGVFLQREGKNVDSKGTRVPVFASKGDWKGMFLYDVKGKNKPFCELVPKTTGIIESLQLNTNFGFAFFSDLTPGTHIAAHTGSSNLRLRCHVGIHVPETDTVQIRVGEEWRPWKQNSCIFFDDSFEHEVFHRGTQVRSVLIVDLWHPSLTPTEVQILSSPVLRKFGKIHDT